MTIRLSLKASKNMSIRQMTLNRKKVALMLKFKSLRKTFKVMKISKNFTGRKIVITKRLKRLRNRKKKRNRV